MSIFDLGRALRHAAFAAAALLISFVALNTVLSEGMKRSAPPALQATTADLPTQMA
jgi:hypothetical protein